MIGASPSLEAALGLKQFMHIETFGRTTRRVDGKQGTLSEILGKIAQAPVAVSDVAAAEPMGLVQGVAPQDLAPEAERLASSAIDSRT